MSSIFLRLILALRAQATPIDTMWVLVPVAIMPPPQQMMCHYSPSAPSHIQYSHMQFGMFPQAMMMQPEMHLGGTGGITHHSPQAFLSPLQPAMNCSQLPSRPPGQFVTCDETTSSCSLPSKEDDSNEAPRTPLSRSSSSENLGASKNPFAVLTDCEVLVKNHPSFVDFDKDLERLRSALFHPRPIGSSDSWPEPAKILGSKVSLFRFHRLRTTSKMSGAVRRTFFDKIASQVSFAMADWDESGPFFLLPSCESQANLWMKGDDEKKIMRVINSLDAKWQRVYERIGGWMGVLAWLLTFNEDLDAPMAKGFMIWLGRMKYAYHLKNEFGQTVLFPKASWWNDLLYVENAALLRVSDIRFESLHALVKRWRRDIVGGRKIEMALRQVVPINNTQERQSVHAFYNKRKSQYQRSIFQK